MINKTRTKFIFKKEKNSKMTLKAKSECKEENQIVKLLRKTSQGIKHS